MPSQLLSGIYVPKVPVVPAATKVIKSEYEESSTESPAISPATSEIRFQYYTFPGSRHNEPRATESPRKSYSNLSDIAAEVESSPAEESSTDGVAEALQFLGEDGDQPISKRLRSTDRSPVKLSYAASQYEMETPSNPIPTIEGPTGDAWSPVKDKEDIYCKAGKRRYSMSTPCPAGPRFSAQSKNDVTVQVIIPREHAKVESDRAMKRQRTISSEVLSAGFQLPETSNMLLTPPRSQEHAIETKENVFEKVALCNSQNMISCVCSGPARMSSPRATPRSAPRTPPNTPIKHDQTQATSGSQSEEDPTAESSRSCSRSAVDPCPSSVRESLYGSGYLCRSASTIAVNVPDVSATVNCIEGSLNERIPTSRMTLSSPNSSQSPLSEEAPLLQTSTDEEDLDHFNANITMETETSIELSKSSTSSTNVRLPQDSQISIQGLVASRPGQSEPKAKQPKSCYVKVDPPTLNQQQWEAEFGRSFDPAFEAKISGRVEPDMIKNFWRAIGDTIDPRHISLRRKFTYEEADAIRRLGMDRVPAWSARMALTKETVEGAETPDVEPEEDNFETPVSGDASPKPTNEEAKEPSGPHHMLSAPNEQPETAHTKQSSPWKKLAPIGTSLDGRRHNHTTGQDLLREAARARTNSSTSKKTENARLEEEIESLKSKLRETKRKSKTKRLKAELKKAKELSKMKDKLIKGFMELTAARSPSMPTQTKPVMKQNSHEAVKAPRTYAGSQHHSGHNPSDNPSPGTAPVMNRPTPSKPECTCVRLHEYFRNPLLQHPSREDFPGKGPEFWACLRRIRRCPAHNPCLRNACDTLVIAWERSRKNRIREVARQQGQINGQYTPLSSQPKEQRDSNQRRRISEPADYKSSAGDSQSHSYKRYIPDLHAQNQQQHPTSVEKQEEQQ